MAVLEARLIFGRRVCEATSIFEDQVLEARLIFGRQVHEATSTFEEQVHEARLIFDDQVREPEATSILVQQVCEETTTVEEQVREATSIFEEQVRKARSIFEEQVHKARSKFARFLFVHQYNVKDENSSLSLQSIQEVSRSKRYNGPGIYLLDDGKHVHVGRSRFMYHRLNSHRCSILKGENRYFYSLEGVKYSFFKIPRRDNLQFKKQHVMTYMKMAGIVLMNKRGAMKLSKFIKRLKEGEMKTYVEQQLEEEKKRRRKKSSK